MRKESYTIDWYGSTRKFERIIRQYARSMTNRRSENY